MPTPIMQKGLWHRLRNSVCCCAKEKTFNSVFTTLAVLLEMVTLLCKGVTRDVFAVEWNMRRY